MRERTHSCFYVESLTPCSIPTLLFLSLVCAYVVSEYVCPYLPLFHPISRNTLNMSNCGYRASENIFRIKIYNLASMIFSTIVSIFGITLFAEHFDFDYVLLQSITNLLLILLWMEIQLPFWCNEFSRY